MILSRGPDFRKADTLRVKCDETFPVCGGCARAHLECPGPNVGLFFIDMNAKLGQYSEAQESWCEEYVSNYVHVLGQPSVAPRLVQGLHLGPGVIFSQLRPVLKATASGSCEPRREIPLSTATSEHPSSDNASMEMECKLPSTYAPSLAPHFDEMYLANFLACTSARGLRLGSQVWVDELPRLLLATNDPTLTYSSRAASVALYGRMAGSETLQLEACKWYARCLRFQHANFQKAAAETDNPSVLHTAMMATHLLSVFESTILTSSSGWITHSSAAVEMILLKGPKYWQQRFGASNILLHEDCLGKLHRYICAEGYFVLIRPAPRFW